MTVYIITKLRDYAVVDQEVSLFPQELRDGYVSHSKPLPKGAQAIHVITAYTGPDCKSLSIHLIKSLDLVPVALAIHGSGYKSLGDGYYFKPFSFVQVKTYDIPS